MLTVLTSGKAAPGVTTAACALAVSWPRPVLLVDCDPAGGDVVPGMLAGRLDSTSGLLSWSAAARNELGSGASASALLSHAVQVPEHPMLGLVPGFSTAAQGSSFTRESWERLAAALGTAERALGRDVLVDSGRLVGEKGCWPVLRAADQVLLAVRPSLRSVHAAQDALGRLRVELGDLDAVSALVVGSGPYSSTEVVDALGVPLAGHLPDDSGAAAALSDGHELSSRALRRSSLMSAGADVAQRLSAAQPRLAGVSA